MGPRSPKLNNSAPLRVKRKYPNCTIPPGFPGDPGGRPTGKKMKGALISPKFVFNLHMYGRPNGAIVNSYYLYSVLYCMFNYLFNIFNFYSVFDASVPLNSSFNIQLFIKCSTFYSTFNCSFNFQLFLYSLFSPIP